MGYRRIASPERKRRRIEAQQKRRAVVKLARKPRSVNSLFFFDSKGIIPREFIPQGKMVRVWF